MTNEIYFEQLTEAFERYEQAMEALRSASEAWYEAIQQWTEIQREALYRRLRRLHLPHWLARFLAWCWPERWLPWPEGVG